MAGPFDFTGQNIQDTYQRVLQTDGTNIYDGTGSLFTLPSSAFPFTGSARITGSLTVVGNQALTGSILISGSNFIRFHHTSSGTNANFSDLSAFRYSVYDTPALRLVRPDGIGFTLYRQGSANNFWVGDEGGNRNMTLYSLAMGAFTFTAPGQGGDFSFTGGSAVDPAYASSIVFRTFDFTTNAVTASDHAIKIQGPNVTGSNQYNLVSFQAGSTFAEKAAIRYDGGAYFSSSVLIGTGSNEAVLFVKNAGDVTGGTKTSIFEHRWGVNALVQTQRYGIIVRTADATSAIGIGAGALQSYDYVTNAYGGIALNYLGGSVAVGRIILGTADDNAKFVVRGRGATSATRALLIENTNATASLVVLDNGFVGINTGSAAYNLDVNGSSAFRGRVNIFGEAELRQDGITQIFTSAYGIFQLRGWSTNNLTAYLNGWNYEGYLNFALNVGTGSIATPSAVLEATSTTRGFRPPRTATTASISSPAQGLMTYLTGSTNEGLYYYNSGSQVGWHRMLTNTGSQSITGSLTVTGASTFATGLVISSSTTINDTLTINIDEGDGPVDRTAPAGFFKTTVNGTMAYLPYYL